MRGSKIVIGGALLAMTYVGGAAAADLTLVASGGQFQESMKKAWWDPVAKQLGITIAEDSQQKAAELRTMVESGNVSWDVLQLGGYSCGLVSDGKLAEKLDYNVIKTDGIRAQVVKDYYVGSDEYTMSIAYSKKKYGSNPPQNWADFWDVKKFPGTRAMLNKPNFSLETALLADGVAGDKLYPIDEERALRKIKELKPAVKVFYTTGGQGTQLIRDGEADLVAIFTNRAQDAIKDGADYGIITDQSVVDIDCYVIPKGSKHKDLAMKFIGGMVSPEINGKIAELTDVAPINQKAWPNISEARRKTLTTNPENKTRLVYLNQEWWGPNLDRLSQVYTAAISN